MRRTTVLLGVAVALAAMVLVSAAGRSGHQRAAAADGGVPAPSDRVVGRCPADGQLAPVSPGDRGAAAHAAVRFTTAVWQGEGGEAVALADGNFRREASSLAEGNLGTNVGVLARVLSLGHGEDAREIAHLCGPDVLSSVVVAEVRRVGATSGSLVYLVRRPAGFRVWAIR
jgi:hypothetical protein